MEQTCITILLPTLLQSWLPIPKKANSSEFMGLILIWILTAEVDFFPGIQVGVDVGEFNFYYFFKMSAHSKGQSYHFSKLCYKCPWIICKKTIINFVSFPLKPSSEAEKRGYNSRLVGNYFTGM